MRGEAELGILYRGCKVKNGRHLAARRTSQQRLECAKIGGGSQYRFVLRKYSMRNSAALPGSVRSIAVRKDGIHHRLDFHAILIQLKRKSRQIQSRRRVRMFFL
jgi:hypothetical protein